MGIEGLKKEGQQQYVYILSFSSLSFTNRFAGTKKARPKKPQANFPIWALELRTALQVLWAALLLA